jgi:hypothetical protein
MSLSDEGGEVRWQQLHQNALLGRAMLVCFAVASEEMNDVLVRPMRCYKFEHFALVRIVSSILVKHSLHRGLPSRPQLNPEDLAERAVADAGLDSQNRVRTQGRREWACQLAEERLVRPQYLGAVAT